MQPFLRFTTILSTEQLLDPTLTLHQAPLVAFPWSGYVHSALWSLTHLPGHQLAQLTRSRAVEPCLLEFFFACFQVWECERLFPWWLRNTSYSNVENSGILVKSDLLLILTELLKAAAISGSSSIIRSFFSATWSFRSLITWETHTLKGSPTSEYITLVIHYLGSLPTSRSSGRCWMTLLSLFPFSRMDSIARPLYIGTWRFFAFSDFITDQMLTIDNFSLTLLPSSHNILQEVDGDTFRRR